MDSKIFIELKNKGYITNPFVKAEDFKTFEELVNSGYVSGIGIKTVYDEIIKSNNIIEKPVEETTKESVEETTKEPVEETTEESVEEVQDIIVDEKEELPEKTITKTTSKKS